MCLSWKSSWRPYNQLLHSTHKTGKVQRGIVIWARSHNLLLKEPEFNFKISNLFVQKYKMSTRYVIFHMYTSHDLSLKGAQLEI